MSDTHLNAINEEPEKKGSPLFLIFIAVVLALALVFIVLQLFRTKEKDDRNGDCSDPGKGFSC